MIKPGIHFAGEELKEMDITCAGKEGVLSESAPACPGEASSRITQIKEKAKPRLSFDSALFCLTSLNSWFF